MIGAGIVYLLRGQPWYISIPCGIAGSIAFHWVLKDQLAPLGAMRYAL
jgi:hypothetical protein